LPEGRHPIIPFFQHSIIPIAERSGAMFQLTIDEYQVVFESIPGCDFFRGDNNSLIAGNDPTSLPRFY
jgi:hypothetical protein